MYRAKWLLIVFIVLSLVFAGVANAGIPKDTLVIGINTSSFITFDPSKSNEAIPDSIIKNLYTRLVNIIVKNGKFIMAPDVAESWEVAADGRTWTFHLRKGIVFVNGDPLKADAVAYSFKRVLEVPTPSGHFSKILGITVENITAPDDYTVKIVTNGATPDVVLGVLAGNVAAIVNPKVVKAHIIKGDFGQGWLKNHSAGAGPYILKEWKRNEKLILVANKRYWRGEPRIKKIVWQDIPEAADQLLLLKKGDIDVAWDLSPEQANSLKISPDIHIFSTPAQGIEYLGMNANWGPFKDVRVRQAVKWAIDYKGIIDKVMSGFALKNQSFIPIGYFGYVESNPYSLDIKKAKNLLAEAGYPDGFDVVLHVYAEEKERNEAIVIQSNLAKIGIRVKINAMAHSRMLAKYRKQGVDMVIGHWGASFPAAINLSASFANYRYRQVAWRLQWNDKYACDLSEASATEMNDDRRFQMNVDLVNYWQAYGPVAVLYQPKRYWSVRNETKGIDKAFEGYTAHFDLTGVYK